MHTLMQNKIEPIHPDSDSELPVVLLGDVGFLDDKVFSEQRAWINHATKNVLGVKIYSIDKVDFPDGCDKFYNKPFHEGILAFKYGVAHFQSRMSLGYYDRDGNPVNMYSFAIENYTMKVVKMMIERLRSGGIFRLTGEDHVMGKRLVTPLSYEGILVETTMPPPNYKRTLYEKSVEDRLRLYTFRKQGLDISEEVEELNHQLLV